MSGRKLGRGLEMLIGKPPVGEASEEVAGSAAAEATGKAGTGAGGAGDEGNVMTLDPAEIERNPDQPRRRFSSTELELLKSSIAKDGILQPVLVRRTRKGYQLVAGERRLRAAQDLRLPSIPALVLDAGDDRMLELALVENIQRENLDPVEVAQAFLHLIEKRGLTQEGVANSVGMSRSQVANTLRLLELPADMQEAVARGRITLGHAKVLLSLDDAEERRLLFEKVAEENLSVRDLEGARESLERERPPSAKGRKRGEARKRKAPQIVSLEEEFSEKLGTRVTVHEGRGKGRIVIEFYSRDDFDRLRELLLGGGPR